MTDLPNVDLFELKIRCDVTPQLNNDERISAIGGSSSVVFLGTNHGRIFHLKNDNSAFLVLGRFQLPNKQEIRQIEFASALGILLVLSHKVLYDIEIDSFQVVSSRSSVQCIAVNSNPIVNDPFCLQLAVATTSKQLHIYERCNSKMELLQKLNTDGNVTAMSFARFTVCFASNGTYCIYSLATKSVISLFPFDPQAIRPHICSVNMEFLVSGMDGLLIPVTEQGVSTRPPILFPSLSIDGVVYSSPYIFLCTKDEITIMSVEDSRVYQTLHAAEIEVLCSLDGSVFVLSHFILYEVIMITVEKQADALFERGEFDEAISLYEKKLRKHFDAECLLNFVALKKKIAFKYIEDRKYEKVADLLISTEVSPEEVISLFERQGTNDFWESTVTWSDDYQFLMDYLQQIRGLPFIVPSRTVVDSILLKLFTIRGNPEAVFSLDNYDPDYRQCAEFLQSFGYYHCAAKMWLLARESSKAWEIWRHLSHGEFKDATFKIEDVVDRIPSITDKKLLVDVLLWLIPRSPKQCIKIAVDNSLLDHKAMKEVLRGNAKLLRIYLEMIPLTDEVTKDLCNIYVSDIVAGDLSCRHRFRHLLMNISASDRCLMYDRLPLECGSNACFVTVVGRRRSAIYMGSLPAPKAHYAFHPSWVGKLAPDLSGRITALVRYIGRLPRVIVKQSAADILEKVVVTYRDYDAAELICSHYSSTQPDVCLRLLKFLEDSAVDDAESRMCSLLKCMGDSVDSRKVITALPESAGIDQVASFLKRAIAKKQNERHMMRSKMCLLERRIEIDKLSVPNDKIVIKDKAICMVCKEALSSSDVLTYLRTGYVIHSKCLRYENLCPLTNSVLIPPK